ncbi:MAG TPA: PDZ domain-containing protein [Longimicrobiales bacterium]|nr:PDZ domain-containing protein [Longimicrobiales bacterium]
MGTGGRMTWMLAVAAVLPLQAAAQARCAEAERVGSLGIERVSCERCRFYSDGSVRRAVFWTEPVIRGLDPEAAAAGVLREGDVLVAIEDALITTVRGQELFSDPPRQREVTVRVRRDGETLDLRVPVSAVCPDEGALPEPVIAGRYVPLPAPTPPAAAAFPASPTAPVTPVPPGTPVTAAVPPAPPAPAIPSLPRARLGFGFRCGPCSSRTSGGDVVWTFESAPEVTGVDRDGPAWEAGLRPGDRILEVDGLDITSADGGRRFGSIRAGERVTWTLERDGRRLERTSAALEREDDRAGPVPTRVADVLRFSGRVGNAFVEVRGAPVTVVEEGSVVVIRTADTEVRIRVPDGSR